MKKRLVVALAGLVICAALVAGYVHAATALTASVNLGVGGSYAKSVDLMTSQVSLAVPTKSVNFTYGAGASAVNMIWTDTRTIAASTTEDLDFAAGGLTDAFGDTVTLARIKTIMVCAASGNTNNVVLGGDANSVPFLSTALTTTSIKPGGCFLLTDPSAGGIAVTAATGDIIQVANSGAGTTVTYDIVVMGATS
jgi:hypothetical protein